MFPICHYNQREVVLKVAGEEQGELKRCEASLDWLSAIVGYYMLQLTYRFNDRHSYMKRQPLLRVGYCVLKVVCLVFPYFIVITGIKNT